MNDASAAVFSFLFFGWMIASWLTHVFYCLMTAKYVLLVAGAFVFPVGMIHGTGLWFGAW
jgi:predicted membrane channel-forming protein YqfA (hemolysin III family)